MTAFCLKLKEYLCGKTVVVVSPPQPQDQTPKPQPPPPPKPQPNKPKFIVPPWMLTAIILQGTREDTSKRSNPIIMEWVKVMDTQVRREYTNDDIPWCGLFVGYCLEKNGFDAVDKPLWALSWAKYGRRLSKPVWGCIGAWRRTGGGHAGFIIGENSTHHYVLGGNQQNMVNVSTQKKSNLAGAVWPHNAADCIQVPLTSTWRSIAVVPTEVLDAVNRS